MSSRLGDVGRRDDGTFDDIDDMMILIMLYLLNDDTPYFICSNDNVSKVVLYLQQ